MVVGFLQALLFLAVASGPSGQHVGAEELPSILLRSYIKMSLSSLRVVVEILRVLYSPLTIVAAITFCAI